jgi:glutamine synthetase
VELRSPDPSCNPYLAFAACLAAGLDGIERKLTPPEETADNLYAMDEEQLRSHGITSLPDTLEAAISALAADRIITDALGPHVTGQYVTGKLREWDEYRSQVTPWELKKYLVTY